MEPDSDVLPTRIGRSEIRREIGSGGVGVVYQAHDPDLSRDVAVKLLRTERFSKGDVGPAQERLRSEARAMAKLAHPNVCAVFDVGTHEGGVYIAMELVEGASMKDWMRSTARPWREVMSMYFQAGLGLAAAHSAGIVHRDFKPANVLVGADRRARVTDFGLASAGPVQGEPVLPGGDVEQTHDGGGGRALGEITDLSVTITDGVAVSASASSSGLRRTSPDNVLDTTDVVETSVEQTQTESSATNLQMTSGGLDATHESLVSSPDEMTRATGVTRTGFVAGTPAYMAPELFRGGRADERSDQFAFAVALYEGLYEERPFAGGTAEELAESVIAGRIRPDSGRTRVPLWIRELVVRGLATNPEDRHPSVRSMLASFAFLARVMWD